MIWRAVDRNRKYLPRTWSSFLLFPLFLAWLGPCGVCSATYRKKGLPEAEEAALDSRWRMVWAELRDCEDNQ